MIFPIGTDNRLSRPPLMNYILIGLNVLIFIYTYQPRMVPTNGGFYQEVLREQAQPYKLYPHQQHFPTVQRPEVYQFVTYAFLHASWMHIIGNMLFLYIFGNNVNDRLGHIGYLFLYLGGAVFSGLGHSLFYNNPVLGASGAVAAITGAYMVLFPMTSVHVFYWFFFVGVTHIPALYFILLKLILWDNMLPVVVKIPDSIAYGAHLAGYVFGITIPLVMLALKWLPHSHFDMWAMIARWRRRREYRQAVRGGFQPFEYNPQTRSQGPGVVDVKISDDQPLSPQAKQIMQLRSDIAAAYKSSDMEGATDKYQELIRIDPQQVLAQQPQLDVVNKLMEKGRHEEAALGYEAFLSHYSKSYPLVEQVELMLGLIYSRYLHRKEPAKKYLQAALEKLSEPNQKKMCADELNRLQAEE